MFKTTWYFVQEQGGKPRGSQTRERAEALTFAAGIARRGRAVEVFSVVVETPSGLHEEPRLVASYASSATAPNSPPLPTNIIPFRSRHHS